MTNKIIFLLLTTFVSFAQPDGYWDKERITNQQIVVSAGDKITIASEDFPTGTTEILYRITLLDENQELSGSLVSLLKSIPDPFGIGKGSAGAVFLMSKVAGNDKCKYGIFATQELANDYQKTGNITKACLFQSEPLSKDAKLLSINKSLCLKEQTQKLWFGFESKNWLLNQKIVLEIVPWIDNKGSRGWNVNNKKSTIEILKKLDLDLKLNNPEFYCIAILDKIQKDYTFLEFKNLSNLEQSKVANDLGYQVLKLSNPNSKLLNSIRFDANVYFKSQKFDEAIAVLNTGIINYNQPTASDFNQIGYYYMFSKQFNKATQMLQKAEILDNANLNIQLNLAHVYLLTNQYSKAKTLYKKYQNQNLNAKTSWINQVQNDFEDFKKVNIQSEYYDKILKKIF